jgi:hypothetical protein
LKEGLMKLRIVIGVLLVLLALSLAASATITWKSKYRKPYDDLMGNIVFGTALPYGEDENFAGVGTDFTWGKFDHLEARAFFPQGYGELKTALLQQSVDRGVFVNPYVYSTGFDVWIDTMKDGKVGDQLAYAGARVDTPDNDWDGYLYWMYDADEGGEVYKVPGKSYPDGIKDSDTVFPDVCLLKPGKYHVEVQFYLQIKGETGGGEWTQGSSGNWTFNPTEGYVNVAVSKGEFTFVVP